MEPRAFSLTRALGLLFSRTSLYIPLPSSLDNLRFDASLAVLSHNGGGNYISLVSNDHNSHKHNLVFLTISKISPIIVYSSIDHLSNRFNSFRHNR